MGRDLTVISQEPEEEPVQHELFVTEENSPMRIFTETHRGKESNANG
jgi:hypothetical protein